MATKINSNGFVIYTNEIINAESFFYLYKNEEILTEFRTIITTSSHHPFATFLAEQRHKSDIKEGDLLILRAVKNSKKFEFISKVCNWGKFSIPKELVSELKIQNHDNILFEVVKRAKPQEKIEDNLIDLSKTNKEFNTIFRHNNFITLFKAGGTSLTLPRYIEITPELIELFYLIHGDGHYQYKLYFVNKYSELHKFVMSKFEEVFKIPKEFWRARLLFNNRSSKEQAKAKWKKYLGLRDEQFYPTISKTVLNTSEDGNLRIVIETPIVSEVFRYIFAKLQNIKGKNVLYALNGILSAEGGARKSNCGLHKITISFSQKEKEMFKNILKEAGILNLSVISQNSRFVISNWRNLYEFFRIFSINKIIPFDIHLERRNKAIRGFLEHSFTNTAYKYLKILSKKQSFTTNEIIAETKYLPNSILSTLRKDQYSRFVKIEGKGINRNPFNISITPEGIEFISVIDGLKLQQNEQ